MNEFFGLKLVSIGFSNPSQVTDSIEKHSPPLALVLLSVLARSLT